MNTLCVIPARYASTRLPGKPLADIAGKPMIVRVYEQASKAAVPMQGDTMPYQVGLFRFAPDCGLYFICGFTEDGQDEDLEYLLDWLGATGIGGKVSSGYGKFHVVQKHILRQEPQE